MCYNTHFLLIVNDPPTAIDDYITVLEDSDYAIVDVISNDSGNPDSSEALFVESVTQPADVCTFFF